MTRHDRNPLPLFGRHHRRATRLLVLLCLAALGLTLVIGGSLPGAAAQDAGAAAATSNVQRYEGFTHPSKELPLEAYIDGVLEKLHVQTGDKFKNGDVLVSLDDDMQALAVEVARLQSESTAQILVAEARVAEAEVELENQTELQNNGSATPRDVRRAEAGLAIARAELKQAEENQRLAAKQYEIEKERLGLYTHKATFDGEVLSMAKEQSGRQGISEGAALRQNDPIMHLAKLDPIHARISLPLDIVNEMRVDALYPIGIGRRGNPINARLKRVASEADRGSQLIEVEFEVPNPDGEIRSGLRCRLLSDKAVVQQSKP